MWSCNVHGPDLHRVKELHVYREEKNDRVKRSMPGKQMNNDVSHRESDVNTQVALQLSFHNASTWKPEKHKVTTKND